jgi:arginase family enzyme
VPNLIAGNNLIGFYLVEVAPPNDSSELTAQHGATLIIDGLSEGFPLQINSFSPSIT